MLRPAVCQGRLRASHTKPTKIAVGNISPKIYTLRVGLSNKNQVYRINCTQKYQKIPKIYQKYQKIIKNNKKIQKIQKIQK
jgi:hypothetical protein